MAAVTVTVRVLGTLGGRVLARGRERLFVGQRSQMWPGTDRPAQ